MKETNDSKIIVYGKPNCSFCKRASALLESKKLNFDYIDLSDNQTALDYIKSIGCRTVPQIFINGTHVGGYDDLVEYFGEQYG